MAPLKFEDFEPRKFSNLEEKINEELKKIRIYLKI